LEHGLKFVFAEQVLISILTNCCYLLAIICLILFI